MHSSFVSPTRQHVSTDHMWEVDTHKRNSLQSLQNGYTGSLRQLQSLTILHSKTEYSQGKSEVTLGADKRRKLLTQEDFDLKTLNQKISFDTNESPSSSSASQQKAQKMKKPTKESQREEGQQPIDGTENLECSSNRTNKKSNKNNNSFSNNILNNINFSININNNNNSAQVTGSNQNHSTTKDQQLASLDQTLQQLKLVDLQPAISNDSRMKSSNLPLNNLINSSGTTTAFSAMIISENNSNNIKAQINNNNNAGVSNSMMSNQSNIFARSQLVRKKPSLVQNNQEKVVLIQSPSNNNNNTSSHPLNSITTNNYNALNNLEKFSENVDFSLPQILEQEDVSVSNALGQSDIKNRATLLPQNNPNLTQTNPNSINLNHTASGQQLLKSMNSQKQQHIPNTGMRLLGNVLAIGKVKKKLMSLTGFFKYKSLGLMHFSIIQDLASEGFWMSQAKTKDSNPIANLKSQNTNKFNLNSEEPSKRYQAISPDHQILALWDIIVLFALVTLFVLAPIDSAFAADFNFSTWHELLCASIFSIDLFVNLNRGYYDEGRVITDRKLILYRYSHGKLYLDILNILAAILFQDIHIILVFLASLYRLGLSRTVWERIEEDLEILHRFPTVIQMVDLCAMIFFIAHLCACGFFYISKSDHQSGVKLTWIQYYGIQDSSWDIQYLYSIYFEFITMTTIGYGDIVPCSSNEKVFVIFMTLISCGVFGYSINEIGQIFKDLSTQLSSFKQTKYDISKYLKSRGIAKKVQMKVYKYLEYLNRQENEGYFFMKGEKILNRVSQDLREEVQREYYGKIVQSIPFFTKSFSHAFLDELALHMKELNLAPGEYLFKQGSQDSNVFFLNKGALDITVSLLKKIGNNPSSNNNTDNSKDKILTRINIPTLIGHQEFLTDQERKFSVRSLGISHFIYIGRQDFIGLIKKYQLDYETFNCMKDDLIYKRIDRFSICESCQKTGHNLLECSLIFGKNDSLKIVRKMNYSEDNDRNICLRRQKLDKKHQHEYWRIRSDLIRLRKEFISKAIKKNQEQHKRLDSISEESANDGKTNNNNNNANTNSKTSPHIETETGKNNNNNNNDSLSNLNQLQQITQPNSNPDQLTMKSYSKKQNNTSECLPDDDKEFFKNHDKIKYEEGEYLIMSSSNYTSSESSEDDEEYDEYDDPYAKYEDEQLRTYRAEEEAAGAVGIQSDQRKSTFSGVFDRNQRKRATGVARTVIPGSPNSKASQDMQLFVPSLFSLDAPNPTFLANRHSTLLLPQGQQQQSTQSSQQGMLPQQQQQQQQSSQQVSQSQAFNVQQSISNNSSSMNSLPMSQLSAIQQYQQQNSLSVQNTSPNLQPAQPQQQQMSHSLQPTLNTNYMNNSNSNINGSNTPNSTNINQLIISLNNNRNYFDQLDPQEELDNNNAANSNNNNSKRGTMILPTVDEASEVYEQSQDLLSSTMSHQLSSSPLVRKTRRKESSSAAKRHTQHRITGSYQNLDDPRAYRRNSSRNDSLSTQKLMRDSRKVTLVDLLSSQIPTVMQQQSQQLTPQQQQQQQQQLQSSLASSYLNILNSTSFTLPRTISKSQSRNSRFYQTHLTDRIPTRSLLHNSNSANPTIHNMFLYTFDSSYEFKYYYPHNNLSAVLKTRAKVLRKKRAKTPRKLYSNSNNGVGLASKSNSLSKTEGAWSKRTSKVSKQALNIHSYENSLNNSHFNLDQ